jgi:di/tricarboxylate transporter
VISLALILLVIFSLIFLDYRPSKVFAAVLVINLALGTVTIDQIISNASNDAVVTLMILLVCSTAMDKTSALKRLGRQIISESYPFTYWRMVLLSGLSSAILNNTAVVATLLSTIRNNTYHSPSKLLIPLSFAAIFGGTMTLIGTSTNLIVNSMWINEGNTPFGFFDFTLIGAAIMLASLAVLFALTPLLPEIKPGKKNVKEYFIEARVSPGSALIGKSIQENKLRSLHSLFLVEIIRHDRLISPVTPAEVIEADDSLVFVGDVKAINELQAFNGITLFAGENGLLQQNLVEVVIANRSNIIGTTLKQAGFRDKFDAAVVAMQRDGEPVSGKLGEVVLQEGDNLVLAVGPDFINRHNISRNFFLLSDIKLFGTLSTRKETVTIAGFLITISLAAFQVLPLLDALIYYLSLLLFGRILSINDIRQKFPIDLWVILTSAMTLGTGLVHSGILEDFANYYHEIFVNLSPFWLLVSIYFLTMALTELITNAAAAALTFPIGYGLAQVMGVDPLPIVMAVAYAASASFLLPYGYQTNLMVYNTGGYRLKHFFSVGLGISITYSAVVLSLIPVVFPF